MGGSLVDEQTNRLEMTRSGQLVDSWEIAKRKLKPEPNATLNRLDAQTRSEMPTADELWPEDDEHEWDANELIY